MTFRLSAAEAWDLELPDVAALTTAYDEQHRAMNRARDYRAAVIAEMLYQANMKDPGEFNFGRFFPSLADEDEDHDVSPEDTRDFMKTLAVALGATIAERVQDEADAQ